VGPVGDDVDVGGILKSLRRGVAGREREKRAVLAHHAPDFVHETDERKQTPSLVVDDDSRDVLQKVVGRHRVKKIVFKGEWLSEEVGLHQMHIRAVGMQCPAIDPVDRIPQVGIARELPASQVQVSGAGQSRPQALGGSVSTKD